MPDSTTVSFIGHFLSTIDPSWSLVTLLCLGGVIYLIVLVLKSSVLSKAIVDKLGQHADVGVLVREIREDQKLSNLERQEQHSVIEDIAKRMDKLETDVSKLTCQNSASCPNRKVE